MAMDTVCKTAAWKTPPLTQFPAAPNAAQYPLKGKDFNDSLALQQNYIALYPLTNGLYKCRSLSILLKYY